MRTSLIHNAQKRKTLIAQNYTKMAQMKCTRWAKSAQKVQEVFNGREKTNLPK